MNRQCIIDRRGFLKFACMTGGAITLAPLLKACANLTAPATSPPGSPAALEPGILEGLQGLDLDTFFREAYRRWARRDPENLTTLGLADRYGVGDEDLTDISDAFVRETQALEAGTLTLLRSYDRTSLAESQSVSAGVYEWFLDDLVRGHPFMYDDYPVNPIITSVHYNLYALFTIYHPLKNPQDASDYISRLSQVGQKFSQLIDGLKRREERGVVLPAFLIRYVQSDINTLARGEASKNDYFITFVERLEGVTEEERKAFSAQVETQVRDTVMPAYQALSGFLGSQQAKAGNAVGVWQFADGEACYAQCLRRHTTTEMTAEQVHRLGKEHVQRIQEEMRERFSALGYPAGEGLPGLFERLAADGQHYRGQEAVSAYERAIAEAEAMLPQAFEILPRARVKVVGGRDGDYYMPASFDNSRPGLFFARTTGSTPRFGVKTLAFHETVPGHHLQTALAQEVPDLPEFRRAMQFNAYTEGWALYAERLMWELGAYEGDPQGDLGRLQMEAYRAARLVVDTGVHAQRWSFEQAVDYLAQASGFTTDYAQAEITRYSVWPGQATSYYIGFLKLLDLRDKAKAALGGSFDLKAWHTLVLANGSVPIRILEALNEKFAQGKI